jgi:TRAP-type C4-dicarboxylate transport system permease small subunit
MKMDDKNSTPASSLFERGRRETPFATSDETDGMTANQDAPVPRLGVEDMVGLGLFWATGAVIFLQFFTRYALNDSFGWTEEIGRYLLIGMTFIGAAAAVKRHAHVNMTYLHTIVAVPVRRVMAALIDLVSIVILGALTYFAIKLANAMSNQPMTSINMSMGIVYWTVAAGIGAMTLRAIVIAIRNIGQRYGER